MTAIQSSLLARSFRSATERSPTVRAMRWLLQSTASLLPIPVTREVAMNSLIEGYEEMAQRYQAMGRLREAEMTWACAEALRRAAQSRR